MSQVYRIRLSSSVSRTLQASDEMRHRVELTEILGKEDMKEVLKKVLESEGWSEQEDGTWKKKGPNGEDMTWDLEQGTVRARVEVEKEVNAEVSASGYGDSTAGARRDAERALERQKERAKGEMSRAEKELEHRLTQQLEESEEARLRELNGVIQKVYSDALKRKASQLGTVMSVDEKTSGDDYELVIQISE